MIKDYKLIIQVLTKAFCDIYTTLHINHPNLSSEFAITKSNDILDLIVNKTLEIKK